MFGKWLAFGCFQDLGLKFVFSDEFLLDKHLSYSLPELISKYFSSSISNYFLWFRHHNFSWDKWVLGFSDFGWFYMVVLSSDPSTARYWLLYYYRTKDWAWWGEVLIATDFSREITLMYCHQMTNRGISLSKSRIPYLNDPLQMESFT